MSRLEGSLHGLKADTSARADYEDCRHGIMLLVGPARCRRATSDTDASPVNDSAMICALVSADQRRRRPVPVITSIRRMSPALGSSVWSSIWARIPKTVLY